MPAAAVPVATRGMQEAADLESVAVMRANLERKRSEWTSLAASLANVEETFCGGPDEVGNPATRVKR